jgi:hypothetical protein
MSGEIVRIAARPIAVWVRSQFGMAQGGVSSPERESSATPRMRSRQLDAFPYGADATKHAVCER